MARVDTEQAAALASILAKLRTFLSLDERSCWPTLQPPDRVAETDVYPGGDFFVTVAIGPGQFDESLQVGGGRHQVTEDTQIMVTGYTRIKLDSRDRDERILLDPSRGLYAIKRRLMDALADEDLEVEADKFLRELLPITGASEPQYDAANGIGWISIYVGLSFDWNLTQH